MSRAIAQQKHVLCTLSLRRSRREIWHRGRVLPLQNPKARHYAVGYEAAGGRAAKQQFRAQWAREQYKDVIKQNTESVWHQTEVTTDATYVTFGQLVVQYGGWSWRPAVQNAQNCASMCASLGPPWAFRDGFSGLLMFRVVSVNNQERIHKAWSLVPKAEMQIGDDQPCLFSDDSFPHASSLLVCQRADVGVFCQEVGRKRVIDTVPSINLVFSRPWLVLGLLFRVVCCRRVLLSSCISSYPIGFVLTR